MRKDMADYIGIHWYKCDLHLHTPASECYLDKQDTAVQWVARAKEQGLDCAAVTDHNDYRSVDSFMEEGRRQGLAVFPGVEITCDSTKIHLLILFDTCRNGNTVRDFLSKCDIDSELVGGRDGTSLSAFEVCRIARKRGALVIAAHIDEFSSISGMNPANLEKILSPEYLDGVQVANLPVWEQYKKDKDSDAMYRAIAEKYGPDAVPEEVERWRKTYERALSAGIPMIAASDNPRSEMESKHGLWGIGRSYTWIKMNDKVDAESVRQSLLSPDTRIRMCFESRLIPYEEPDFWVRSAEFRNTVLNPHQPIRLDFNPQLNCIIGGRGSGKSAVVRLLCGAWNCLAGTGLSVCQKEMRRFYSESDEETGNGVFQPDSEIEICFRGFGSDWKLLLTDIRSEEEQTRTLFRLEEDGLTWTEVRGSYYSELFRPDVFIENQIYEIARTPGALLALTDGAVSGIREKLRERELLKERCLTARMELRTVLHELSEEAHQDAARKDYAERLRAFGKKTGGACPDLCGALEAFLKKPHDREAEKRVADCRGTLEEQGIPSAKLSSLLETYAGLCRKESRADELGDAVKKLETDSSLLLEQYDACLASICALRSDSVRTVLADDENIRMEVLPHADRVSFHMIFAALFPEGREALSADEALLFGLMTEKKDGIRKYREALSALRSASGSGEPSEFTPRFRSLLRGLDETAFDRLYLFCPEDELRLFYRPNGVKKFFPMNAASAGERAIAVLTFILAQGEVPLIMDQPEDGLDNRVVFELLVRDLKRIKQTRQLILVTHNANIPVNADAEYILSMDPWAKYTKVRMAGTMDEEEIRREICDVMEGTDRAFSQRAKKYHL